MMHNRLLIDDRPLQVLPSLACAIGLNEAIVLQQLHYRLRYSKNYRDNKPWVYDTYEDWNVEHFPFWSLSTVKRTFKSLSKMGLVLHTSRYNKANTNRTQWFTIDYDVLQTVSESVKLNLSKVSNWNDPSVQNDTLKTIDLPIEDPIEATAAQTAFSLLDDRAVVSSLVAQRLTDLTAEMTAKGIDPVEAMTYAIEEMDLSGKPFSVKYVLAIINRITDAGRIEDRRSTPNQRMHGGADYTPPSYEGRAVYE